MPDLLLIIISVVCIVIDLLSGLNFGSEAFREQSITFKLFDDWFFNNPWVIAAQNLFHSPLLVAIYIAASYWFWQKGIKGMAWFFWLSCASMLHTVIDIFVHYDDGPLLLFPLNWNLRFQSPVSYWDPEHYGVPFAIFEHSLDMLILGFFLLLFIRGRMKKEQ